MNFDTNLCNVQLTTMLTEENYKKFLKVHYLKRRSYVRLEGDVFIKFTYVEVNSYLPFRKYFIHVIGQAYPSKVLANVRIKKKKTNEE